MAYHAPTKKIRGRRHKSLLVHLMKDSQLVHTCLQKQLTELTKKLLPVRPKTAKGRKKRKRRQMQIFLRYTQTKKVLLKEHFKLHNIFFTEIFSV